MKTRLNPLESQLHNSPTPEEVQREVAINKNRPHFDLLAVLFLSLAMLVTSCSKQEAASNASAAANEPVKAKPFEGQIFRTADDRQAITLVSQDELEMRGGDAGAENLICKYTRQDDTLRVVQTMLGTTRAVYYKITPDGLQANDGTVLLNPAKFLYVKALTSAQIARAAWTEQLARMDTAILERHAAAEFQQIKAQVESAAGLMAKQPEQAAQQFGAGTAKLKDLFAQAWIKENLARLDSALGQGNKFQALRNLAELERLIPGDPRLIGLREKAAALSRPKEMSVDLGGGVAMELVFIWPDSFSMGEGNEKHQVTLTKPFYMGKYEVTQEQWQALMGSNHSSNKGAKNPVQYVSWNDCQQFVAKLNEKLPGLKASLPTEAQWEYACRAGSATKFCYGDGEASLAEYGWYGDGDVPHPVGTKKPNAWGLYDMHGNLAEWCADWYGSLPGENVIDPQGPRSGLDRVIRGGWIGSYADDCRSAARSHSGPAGGGNAWGFRVVLAPAQ